MRMISTRYMKYGARTLQPGQEFDTETDEHAAVLEAAGKAKRAPVKRQYRRRDMQAES